MASIKSRHALSLRYRFRFGQVATSAGYFPSDVRWESVSFNGLKGIDTQEVRGKNGPF